MLNGAFAFADTGKYASLAAKTKSGKLNAIEVDGGWMRHKPKYYKIDLSSVLCLLPCKACHISLI